MNLKLKTMYSENWNNFQTEMFKGINDNLLLDKPTNPLTISLLNNEYENADIKVMIFGQETNSWEGDFCGDLDFCLDLYSNFNGKRYGKNFWNSFYEIKKKIEDFYEGKSVGVVWNNIIKTGNSGRDRNAPPAYIIDVEKNHFNIIQQEIEILSPDVIIFLTGPNYDKYLSKAFNDIKFEKLDANIPERQLARLITNSRKNIFRTYHPNFLNRNGLRLDYFDKTIKSIEL